MKAAGKLTLVNKKPTVLIHHEDLEAIRHIVAIAPQEAQWFHRMDRIVEDNYVLYHIYEMYIPEQYCSAAEVDTSPEMMMSFYKELRDEQGQEKANEIMANLTVWCHSHHNMAVSPSGQDRKQFEEQVDNAVKAGVTIPQMMFIFNKKDEYFCRIWDPEYKLTFENPEMLVGTYDFTHLTQQAKKKFKKKPVQKRTVVTTSPSHGSIRSSGSVIDWRNNDWQENFGWNINSTTAVDTPKKK
tara:strand:- start:15 stop:737 length:723 start_codon:yes stop_codon:yes gene_type:complete